MQTAKRYEARIEFVFDGARLAPMARQRLVRTGAPACLGVMGRSSE